MLGSMWLDHAQLSVHSCSRCSEKPEGKTELLGVQHHVSRSKLSSLRQFYQKKLCKSSCDAILSQEDEHMKENQPLQGESKMYFKQFRYRHISRKMPPIKILRSKACLFMKEAM